MTAPDHKLAIVWTRAKVAMLRAQYDEACKARQPTFEYVEKEEDKPWSPVLAKHTLDVRYAHYLLEYLEGEFARTPTPRAPENREGEEGQ